MSRRTMTLSRVLLFLYLLCQCVTLDQQDEPSDNECGVWVAMSTLPGTGIGMYAGKQFKKWDVMMAGDHTIPIIDREKYQGGNIFFLWEEYTWMADWLGQRHVALDSVSVASSGFGSTANSFMDFYNVEEGLPEYSVAQKLSRSKDPGAGAFTYYHSRKTFAKRTIEPGQELFVSYGDKWFTGREYLGPIPVTGDHGKAENLYRKFKQKLTDQNNSETSVDIAWEAWDTFVLNSTWKNTSRVIAALPPKEDYESMLQIGLVTFKEKKMRRSREWLQQNGICADNMHLDVSTIPQAGHGGFASRFLAKGSTILPIPLIHIPFRKVLDMYSLKFKKSNGDEGIPDVVRRQLLLNYCLGHAESTVLLSPYGPVFNFINHNQTLANVRLQWARPEKSNHHPEMLEKKPEELEAVKSASIAMELVALRDIIEGEEIILDYGDEWEKAWQEHVQNWNPVEGANTYVSGPEFNELTKELRTEFEQMKEPYPTNVVLKFYLRFEDPIQWKDALRQNGDLTKFFNSRESNKFADCDILRYREVDGRIIYHAAIKKDGKDKLVEAPREAFTFVDRPYSDDMLLTNAFRHEIGIPDDIFPDAWRNLRKVE